MLKNDISMGILTKEKTEVSNLALTGLSLATLTALLGAFSATAAFALLPFFGGDFKLATVRTGLGGPEALTDGNLDSYAPVGGATTTDNFYEVDLLNPYQLSSLTLYWKDFMNRIASYTVEGYAPNFCESVGDTNSEPPPPDCYPSWVGLISGQPSEEVETFNFSPDYYYTNNSLINESIANQSYSKLRITVTAQSGQTVGIYELKASDVGGGEVATGKPVYGQGDLIVEMAYLWQPPMQNIVAGTRDFEFAKLVLDTRYSGEDIEVSRLQMNLTTTGNGAPYKISNVRLMVASSILSLTNNPDPVSTIPNSSATSTFILQSPLLIRRGAATVISLKADVSTTAQTGEVYQWGIKPGAEIIATGTYFNDSIIPNYSYYDGTRIIVVLP